MIVVLLLGAAATLWGATELSWRTGGDTGTGGPGLGAVALLALAALAGVFAVGGWARRLLGAVVLVVGGWVCRQALVADGDVDLLTGRGLALLGGVLLLAAGAVIVVRAARLPTMGARYERAHARRRSGDAGKDMWDGLSDGEDPTVGGPRT
jgi:hypothetical protein